MTLCAKQQGLPLSSRPDIENCQSGDEFTNWYWLKEELVTYCRKVGLPYTGSKQEITDRVAHWIDNGEIIRPVYGKSKSKFDWHRESLTLETVITDSYRNSQNVRRFMKEHYGPNFKFNIAFMDWMKANVGKTLADAIKARREIEERGKAVKPAIPASNQYNRYTRDFFASNPARSVADARRCWKYKRSLAGHNRYEESDLVALKVEN